MARYRTYKNGITGHKYKGYYIIKGENKGQFAIWREDKSVFKDGIYDLNECEWIIDKETADEKTLKLIKDLYSKEIFELSGMFVQLMQKSWDKPLTEEEKYLYGWVEKVRARKAGDREY